MSFCGVETTWVVPLAIPPAAAGGAEAAALAGQGDHAVDLHASQPARDGATRPPQCRKARRLALDEARNGSLAFLRLSEERPDLLRGHAVEEASPLGGDARSSAPRRREPRHASTSPEARASTPAARCQLRTGHPLPPACSEGVANRQANGMQGVRRQLAR